MKLCAINRLKVRDGTVGASFVFVLMEGANLAKSTFWPILPFYERTANAFDLLAVLDPQLPARL